MRAGRPTGCPALPARCSRSLGSALGSRCAESEEARTPIPLRWADATSGLLSVAGPAPPRVGGGPAWAAPLVRPHVPDRTEGAAAAKPRPAGLFSWACAYSGNGDTSGPRASQDADGRVPGGTSLGSPSHPCPHPRGCLRTSAVVWGRRPVRTEPGARGPPGDPGLEHVRPRGRPAPTLLPPPTLLSLLRCLLRSGALETSPRRVLGGAGGSEGVSRGARVACCRSPGPALSGASSLPPPAVPPRLCSEITGGGRSGPRRRWLPPRRTR